MVDVIMLIIVYTLAAYVVVKLVKAYGDKE